MDLIIAKTIGLLMVAILVAIAARRLQLPYTVGLVIAGMALALSQVDLGISLTRDIIFDIILPPLLFEAALNLHWGELRRDAMPVLLLSVLGVVISTSTVFLGVRTMLGWPAESALILGVLVSATDPVAVIALFRDLGIKGRTKLLVESESLFNDGVAAVLFSLALTWAGGKSLGAIDGAHLLLVMSGGGIVVGAAAGAIALLVAGRTGDHLVETAVTVVAAYGAFLGAEYFHFSGVLATVTAGLIVGSVGFRAGGQKFGVSHQGRVFALEFWEFLAFLVNSVVFLLIGLAASHIGFTAMGYLPLIVVIVLAVVGRAASVYPICWLIGRSRWAINAKQQHVLMWAGLRGALALALALSLPAWVPMHQAIVLAAFGLVTFSVIVQGLTMRPLLQHLRMTPSLAPPANK